MHLFLHAISDVGLVRSNNEDIALVGDSLVRDGASTRRLSLDDSRPVVFGVADGVGGANSGEVASRKAALGILRGLQAMEEGISVDRLARNLSSLAIEVNDEIVRNGSTSRRNAGMATTLSALIAYRQELVLLHAGDSRVYRLREGRLELLSRDHTVRAMTNNPEIPGNILANCFGVSSDFFADVTKLGSLEEIDERYLICSDGLSDLVDHDEIQQIMNRDETLPRIAEHLVAAAHESGARDNVTLVIAQLGNSAGRRQ
jgi:protein phosphatase